MFLYEVAKYEFTPRKALHMNYSIRQLNEMDAQAFSYSVRFHPLARAELKSSASWYEDKLSGLGLHFATAVAQQAKLNRLELL